MNTSPRGLPWGFVCAVVGLLVSVPATTWGQPAFVDVTTNTGLAGYVASTGDGHGPGGVFTDLNNDGFPELYLVRAPNGGGSPSFNQLYLNVPAPSGGRTFVLLPFSGAGDPGAATGAIAGDYDNDGDMDLYVINFDQPNALLQSQFTQTGVLAFTNVTAQTDPTPDINDNQFGVGIAFFEGVPLDNSLTAAWADVDRDGDLDLYVGNHNGFFNTPVEGPFPVPGRRDVFYINNGDGTFTEATMQFGVPGFITANGAFETPDQRFSSTNAVIFADFNNDAWPDLLVTNKIGGPDDRDMLYINLGPDENGQWQGFATVTYNLIFPPFGAVSGAAMGVDVADFDNDGDLDIYITDWSDPMIPESPGKNDLWINLLSNTGRLAFVLAADSAPSFDAPAKLSWGAQWQDFTNNGMLELHVATNSPFPDHFYLNTGAGFAEVALAASLAQVRNARGDMTADYNRDGWVDLFVVNLDGGPSVLYENNLANLPDTQGAFLTLKLIGDPFGATEMRTSRDAIGARASVSADLNGDGLFGPGETMMREVVSGSSNAGSTSSLELEFGLGLAPNAVVHVLWPSGQTTTLAAPANTHLTIVEGGPPCPADLNADGVVDTSDLGLLISLFGASGPLADLNGDDVVDTADLGILIGAFGTTGC